MKHSEFLEIWNELQADGKTIPSSEIINNWANGTGYMDKGVHATLPCAIGESVAGMDRYGRRVVAHRTPVGNYIVFERYTNAGRDILVQNAPQEVEQLVGGAMELPCYMLYSRAYDTLGIRIQKLLVRANNPNGREIEDD
jgi:hypothetical protein